VALALLASLAPVGEELFVRGLVYGNLREVLRGLTGPLAPWLAGALSAACFVGAHVPQVHGAWGGLVDVSLVAAVTTVLRVATDSTAPPLLAHVSYNAMLAWPVLLSAE
jgi:membrane protease YdiL (CAAX protease family)